MPIDHNNEADHSPEEAWNAADDPEPPEDGTRDMERLDADPPDETQDVTQDETVPVEKLLKEDGRHAGDSTWLGHSPWGYEGRHAKPGTGVGGALRETLATQPGGALAAEGWQRLGWPGVLVDGLAFYATHRDAILPAAQHAVERLTGRRRDAEGLDDEPGR